jgi:hypothetical protein
VLLALFEGHLHLGYLLSIYKLKGSFTLPILIARLYNNNNNNNNKINKQINIVYMPLCCCWWRCSYSRSMATRDMRMGFKSVYDIQTLGQGDKSKTTRYDILANI